MPDYSALPVTSTPHIAQPPLTTAHMTVVQGGTNPSPSQTGTALPAVASPMRIQSTMRAFVIRLLTPSQAGRAMRWALELGLKPHGTSVPLLAQRSGAFGRPGGTGRQTIIHAARAGHIDLVRHLVAGMTTQELALIPTQRDRFGKNAIDYAVERGDAQTLHTLCSHEEVVDVQAGDRRYAADRFDPTHLSPEVASNMSASLSLLADRTLAFLAAEGRGHTPEAQALAEGTLHRLAKVGDARQLRQLAQQPYFQEVLPLHGSTGAALLRTAMDHGQPAIVDLLIRRCDPHAMPSDLGPAFVDWAAGMCRANRITPSVMDRFVAFFAPVTGGMPAVLHAQLSALQGRTDVPPELASRLHEQAVQVGLAVSPVNVGLLQLAARVANGPGVSQPAQPLDAHAFFSPLWNAPDLQPVLHWYSTPQTQPVREHGATLWNRLAAARGQNVQQDRHTQIRCLHMASGYAMVGGNLEAYIAKVTSQPDASAYLGMLKDLGYDLGR